MKSIRSLLAHSLACVSALSLAPVHAQIVTLPPAQTIDVSHLSLTSGATLSFDPGDGHLWMAEHGSANDVLELDLATLQPLVQFDASVVPGLTAGPEAVCVLGAGGDVALFQATLPPRGGRVTQAGVLVSPYTPPNNVRGAFFDDQQRFFAMIATGNGIQFKQLDPATGATLATIAISGTTATAIGATFDPVTRRALVLTFDKLLLEIDLEAAVVTQTQSLVSAIPNGMTVAGGIALDPTGQSLFVTYGTLGKQILVFARGEFASSCVPHVALACPCANVGLPGHGCDNSFSTGGALLSATGTPSLFNDTVQLVATDLVPGGTCLFFQGTQLAAGVPFGDGLRCVQSNVVRLKAVSILAGTATFPGPGDPDVSHVGLVPNSGGARHYQAWYRNAASFCTPAAFNLSNSLSMRWRI